MNTTPDDAELNRTLYEAEQTGLRLAIRGRLVALLFFGAWFAISRRSDPERVVEFVIAISLFGLLGLLHYWLIGSRYDRAWVKYAFITIDVVVVSVLMATQPIYDSVDVPQAMAYRGSYFSLYFVILGVAAFSFSPGLVLWTGAAGIAGWLGGFYSAILDMPVRLDWTDIGTAPTTEEFLSIYFSTEFIATGSRIQESFVLGVVAILIAVVMWRARQTVRRQIELDQERRRISDVFGRYVPRAVADALINDRGLLAPVDRTATVLFVDIAGFTLMMEKLGSVRTIAVLNQFFDRATDIISARNGVVTQFIGDEIMSTFNLPVEDPLHAEHAVLAALDILDLCRQEEFDGVKLRVRAGVCTGSAIGGSIGGGGRETYSIYGDTVNLAARLEALNKEHKTDLMIAASTADLIGDCDLQELGLLSVRGLADPVRVLTSGGRTQQMLTARLSQTS